MVQHLIATTHLAIAIPQRVLPQLNLNRPQIHYDQQYAF